MSQWRKRQANKKQHPKKPIKQAPNTEKEVDNCLKTKEMPINFKTGHQGTKSNLVNRQDFGGCLQMHELGRHRSTGNWGRSVTKKPHPGMIDRSWKMHTWIPTPSKSSTSSILCSLNSTCSWEQEAVACEISGEGLMTPTLLEGTLGSYSL